MLRNLSPLRCVHVSALPLGLWLLLAAPIAAQTADGVVFVDDLEAEMRPTRQLPSMTQRSVPGRSYAGQQATDIVAMAEDDFVEATDEAPQRTWMPKLGLGKLFGDQTTADPAVSHPTQSQRRAGSSATKIRDYSVRPTMGYAGRAPSMGMRPAMGGRPQGIFDRGYDNEQAPQPMARREPSKGPLPVPMSAVRPTTRAQVVGNVAKPGAVTPQQPLSTMPLPMPIAPRQTVPAVAASMPRVTAAPELSTVAPMPTAVDPASVAEARANPRPLTIRNSHATVSRPSTTALQPGPLSSPQPRESGVERPKELTAEIDSAIPEPEVGPVPVHDNPVVASENGPSAKAIEVLTTANSISTTAETEEELTQVAQMCRQVLAIDDSPESTKYARELAAWALNRRGELKADRGLDHDAELDFEDAIRMDSQRWRAIHNRGVLRAQRGEFAEAFDDFARTIELAPTFAKAYSNRGSLYLQAGDFTAALEDFRLAIEHDPDLAVAHKGRGRVCHMLGDFEAAQQHFDAAALLAPTDPFIAVVRADLLTDMGRYQQALDGYRNALSIDPQHSDAHRSLAWLLATCPNGTFRSPRQALEHAQQAVSLGSSDAITLDTLAAAQASAGDFAAAVESITKALSQAEGDQKATLEARRQLYQRNQPFLAEPSSEVQPATYIK